VRLRQEKAWILAKKNGARGNRALNPVFGPAGILWFKGAKGEGGSLTGRRLIGFLTLAVLVTALVCGCRVVQRPGPVEPRAPEPKPPVEAPKPPEKMSVAVYYLKMTANDTYLVREVHEVPRTLGVAEAALQELITGTPKTPGAFKVLPPKTRIRGISIGEGLATVDFSREVLEANVGAAGEALGIQSIVNTLTEFPAIKRVAFRVEGRLDEAARQWWGHVGLYQQPFTRNLSKVYEPAIWVYRPQPNQRVTSPLLVTGSARVFEATVQARLLTEGGSVLARGFGTATAGAPERGDFEIRLEFSSPAADKGWLEVFWISPKDGSELDKVRLPVRFK